MTRSEPGAVLKIEEFGAKAEALRIAERWLLKQGWKFTPAEVGRLAKDILDAMGEGSQVKE